MPIRIAIIACRRVRQQNLCPGCAKCFVAWMRKDGEFARYKDKDAHIVGIIDCAGCRGQLITATMYLLKMHLAMLGDTADVIHIGTCIMTRCIYKDSITKTIKEKAGVEVIEGTHKYIPPKIFP